MLDDRGGAHDSALNSPRSTRRDGLVDQDDPDDFIGQGQQRVYHGGNSTAIDVTRQDDVITAGADGGTYNDSFSFRFRAPDSRLPEPGVYVVAQRLAFEKPGHPAMDVEGMSRGCNRLGGRFEVRDLDVNAGGRVDRLWLLYHRYCEGRPAATWGEIRVNAWVPKVQADVAPGTVRWPPLDGWQRATSVPVTYVGHAKVTAVTLAGAHPEDFTIDSDGCTGRQGACDVNVRFVPTAAGARQAVLRFTDARGRVHESTLEGFAHGGVTRAEFEVMSGDVASTPGKHVYDATNATFFGTGLDTELRLLLFGADGFAWMAPSRSRRARSRWARPSRRSRPGGRLLTSISTDRRVAVTRTVANSHCTSWICSRAARSARAT